MNKRYSFQDFCDGREGVSECFTIGEGEKWCAGAEIAGWTYYFHPYSNNSKKGLVILGVDYMSSILNPICDFSMVRLDALAEHCPCLVQAFKDGCEPRLDRGLFAEVDGKWQFMKSINFDFPKKVEEMGYNMMYDSIIVDTVNDLIRRVRIVYDELDKWNGFSNWEEVKITAKEMLPGAKIGARIGRAMAGLGY